MSLLKRIVFQVGPVPNERAFGLTSLSNDGHFISLRPFVKTHGPSEEQFPFEWAFAGTNKNNTVTKVKEGVVNQDFNFLFDVNVYLNVPNTHRGEIKTVWTNWESGCIAENGHVYPAGADQEAVPFFELWQPLDPTKAELVIPLKEEDLKAKSAKSIVFQVGNDSGYDGLLIVTGKWSQGFLSKKNDGTIKGLNFIRSLETNDSSSLQTLLNYGVDSAKFPTNFNNVKKGDVVNAGGLKWKVIESNL